MSKPSSREGQPHAVSDHRATADLAAAGELADVGVEREVGRPGRLEGLAEVAGPTTDVEHARPAHGRERGELGYGVVGESRVEAVGIRLLVAGTPGAGAASAPGRPDGRGRGLAEDVPVGDGSGKRPERRSGAVVDDRRLDAGRRLAGRTGLAVDDRHDGRGADGAADDDRRQDGRNSGRWWSPLCWRRC